jgi:Uma2 family endonuclease
MAAPDLRRMPLSDYLELDRTSEEPWEYVNGEAYVMSAKPAHNKVKLNVAVALQLALTGLRCFPMPDGQKVATPTTGAYHYPDVTVFCGPLVLDADDDHAATNPTVIVEVLSPTTEDYDRGGKFRHYRSLDSFEEYVLVSPEGRWVEHHRRVGPGQWLMTELRAGDLVLASIGATMPIDVFFADLDRISTPT